MARDPGLLTAVRACVVRNVLDQRPEDVVHGHALYVRTFVDPDDLRDRDVLDVGCGFGWFELVAIEAGARSVTGVEPTPDDLATVRRHVTDERARFEVASVLELPFEPGSFDTIVMWEVLEHLPKRTEGAALAELVRVLRSGGRLYLSTPHSTLASRILDPAWWVAAHRHYSRERLAGLVRNAGLELEGLEVRGGWWQVAYILNLYTAKWIFRRRPFFEAPFTKRLDREWLGGGGFADVLVKARR